MKVVFPPLWVPGARHRIEHPVPAVVCAVVWAACVLGFVRAYMRANPRSARHEAAPSAPPRWSREMTLFLLGALASYALLLLQ